MHFIGIGLHMHIHQGVQNICSILGILITHIMHFIEIALLYICLIVYSLDCMSDTHGM